MKLSGIKPAVGIVVLLAIASVPSFLQLLYVGFTPATVSIPFGISIEELKKHPEPIVWIDARERDLFNAGHVPGALNLNRSNWDQSIPNLFSVYSTGKTIVVYCSPDCTASEEIATKLRDLGFEQVFVLDGGLDGWKRSKDHL